MPESPPALQPAGSHCCMVVDEFEVAIATRLKSSAPELIQVDQHEHADVRATENTPTTVEKLTCSSLKARAKVPRAALCTRETV